MVTNNETLKKLHNIQTQCSARLLPWIPDLIRFGIYSWKKKMHTRVQTDTQVRIHARIDAPRIRKHSRTRMQSHELSPRHSPVGRSRYGIFRFYVRIN